MSSNYILNAANIHVVQLFLQVCLPVACSAVISSMSIGKDSKHCHDSSRALEDREKEKKMARKRLYIVSAICLVFMVGEILGTLVELGFFFFCYEEHGESLLQLQFPMYIILGGCVNRWLFRWQSSSDDGCCPPTCGFH